MYCVYGNSSWYINDGPLFGEGPSAIGRVRYRRLHCIFKIRSGTHGNEELGRDRGRRGERSAYCVMINVSSCFVGVSSLHYSNKLLYVHVAAASWVRS